VEKSPQNLGFVWDILRLHIGMDAGEEGTTVRLGFDSISIPFLAGQK